MIQETGARIRQLRLERGMSLSELSKMVNVSKSLISQVEQGKVLTSLPTLERITTALGVTLGDFFSMEITDHGSDISEEDFILRKEARVMTRIPDTNSFYSLLTPGESDDLDFFLSEFPPGGTAGKTPARSRHDGQEYFYVLEGSPVLSLDGNAYQLNKGDSGSFDSSLIHFWSNRSEETAKVIFVIKNN